jgi:hypothetical protein
LRCRSIDLPAPLSTKEDAVLGLLVAECLGTGTERLVAYRRGQRFVQAYEPVALPPPDSAAARLRKGGCYLITGGLGGVGMELAQALFQTVSARLVLIGRSPPQPAVQARLDGLRAAGAELLIAAADVAEPAAMRAVIAQVQERFGGLHGVIHAAGIAGGGAVQARSLEAAAAVLRPKVQGTLVLDAVLPQTLDFVVLCSSLNALLPRFGQVDYSAANAFLDAFAIHKQGRSGTLFTSINWEAWREVGGAARAAAGEPPTLPPDDFALSTELVPESHWLLDEHRLFGQATLPGSAYLELGYTAGLAAAPGAGTVELEGILLKELLQVADGKRATLHTRLRRSERGFELSVASESADSGLREHARGRLLRTPKRPAPSRFFADRTAALAEVALPADPAAGRPLRLGRRWRCLKRLWHGEGEGVAELALLPELEKDLAEHPLHPALLDAGLGFPGLWLPGIYMPLGYSSVRIFSALSPRLVSHAFYALPDGAAPDTLELDVTLFDPDGKPLLEVCGFSLRRLHAGGG